MSVTRGSGGAMAYGNTSFSTGRKWALECPVNLNEIFASNTDSGPWIQDGNEDWRGVVLCYGHTPARMPGETFVFKGQVKAGKGVTGPAIVDRVIIKADIQNGKPFEHAIFFSSNGAITVGTSVSTSDTSSVNPPCTRTSKVHFDGTTVTDVTDWTLIIDSENKPYVSSNTNGKTKRVEGNKKAEVIISCLTDDPDAMPTLNAVATTLLYVSNTQYWDLTYGKIQTVNITDDIEENEPVSAVVKAKFTGFDLGTKGHLNKPGAVTYWN